MEEVPINHTDKVTQLVEIIPLLSLTILLLVQLYEQRDHIGRDRDYV